MERDPRVEQHIVRGGEHRGVVAVEHARRDQRVEAAGALTITDDPPRPPEGLQVPQATGALLQVGLEHLRDEAGPQASQGRGVGQGVEHGGAALAGHATGVGDQLLGRTGERTADDPGGHQSGQRVEIGCRERA